MIEQDTDKTAAPTEAKPAKSQVPETMAERNRGIDPKLLELIVCPITKATLEYDAVKQELISREAKLAYPIRDGIPIMLSDEARKLD